MVVKRRLEDSPAEEDEQQPGSPSQQQQISIRRRNVNPDELTVKQLERVLKNRQAAQASRERKRTYVSELEASRDLLQAEAVELRSRVQVLEQEKSALSSQVSHLKAEFEELKAFILSDPKGLAGVLDKSIVFPSSASPAAALALRPTDPPAINVLYAASSPSIKLADHPFLGSCRLTQLPLSARTQVAAGSMKKERPGSLMDSTSRLPPRHLKTSSCWTTLQQLAMMA